MLYKGKKIPLNIETLVFLRQSDNLEIVVQAKPADLTYFEKVCPEPQPKVKTFPGGATELWTDDPEYKKALDVWLEKKQGWMVISSLEASKDITWEKVNREDPSTYKFWIDELSDSGLSSTEVNKVWKLVLAANSLDDKKIEAATKRFLAGQAAQK